MKKTFEENVKELEEIVSKLEKGELSLEDSINNFEEGIKLSKECSSALDEAEKKINILVESEGGELKEEKFEIEE